MRTSKSMWRTFIHSALAALIVIGTLALGAAGQPARADSYGDSLTACRDGFIWETTAILLGGSYTRTEIVGSSPPGTRGMVLETFGPGTFGKRFFGKWNTRQLVGASVTVTAEVERPGFAVITLSASVGDCETAGDGFDPGDGRVDPKPGDRIVIYCDETFRDISVWGVRHNSEGYPLTVFEFDDLTLAGPRGIRRVLRGGQGVVSASLDPNGNFYVAWEGGPYGATGQGDFAKYFRCPFEFRQILTPTPSRTPIRLPVVTLTPSPTPTPLPTRAGF